jgi:hypothetical protein
MREFMSNPWMRRGPATRVRRRSGSAIDLESHRPRWTRWYGGRARPERRRTVMLAMLRERLTIAVHHDTPPYGTRPSPSPRPSPPGRGSVVFRRDASVLHRSFFCHAASEHPRAGPEPLPLNGSEGAPAFSLSPGERAGVRGKEVFATRKLQQRRRRKASERPQARRTLEGRLGFMVRRG